MLRDRPPKHIRNFNNKDFRIFHRFNFIFSPWVPPWFPTDEMRR